MNENHSSENRNYITRLGQLEQELNAYTQAMNNAAEAAESTEREIVDILGELANKDEAIFKDSEQ